jgi:toxin ParE1/3/4
MKLVFQPRAREDLLQQVEHLLEAFAYDAAERFPSAVQETCARLLENPEIGSPREYLAPQLAGLRSWPVSGFEDVRLYYIASGAVLRVVRVLHGRRDLNTILETEG